MKKHILFFTATALSAVLLPTGCFASADAAAAEKVNAGSASELLHLCFDEGSGILAADSTKNQEDANVNYRYIKSFYSENRDPQWRANGIENGALLFDGSSTYISYQASDLCISGTEFSVSAWVAPRAFEWDDPNAADQGTHHLTSIISQYNSDKTQGILLGYERYGRLCFEVGTEDGWHTVWGDSNLEKNAWNQVTAVYNGTDGQISLYLNGTLIGSDTVNPGSAIVPADNDSFLIGKNSHGESIAAGDYQMFSGLMDEVVLYDTALSEEMFAFSGELPEIPYEDVALENILTSDIYKTQYHGGPYQHWMNEPHSPLYYNGKYHLFFQQNPVGTYWRNIQWGHLVSDDMVNWLPVKEAIVPTENSVVPDGVWSGNAAYDKNGIPLLFFTAGNDSFAKEGLISNQNIGIAYPADLSDPELLDWVIYPELAVKQEAGQGRPGEFRDPYLWKEGETWCMLICSGSAETGGGAALLYTSDTLELKEDGSIDMNWQYKGSIYEMQTRSTTYGTSWELPILMPLTNKDGSITKYIFTISPAPAGTADNKVYFFLGDFDLETGKFTPDPAYDNAPGLIDYGDNVFTGPSAMVDPVSGEVCVFSIMQDKRNGAQEGISGWAHCVGLTRKLCLNDDGTDVMVDVIDTLDNYKIEDENTIHGTQLSLEEANQLLESASGDCLYIRAVIDVKDTAPFGIILKQGGKRSETRYWYEDGKIFGKTKDRGDVGSSGAFSGPLELIDGKLTMDIYIDRSLVEGYFNESKSISIRSYADFDSQKISFFADGDIVIDELYVTGMNAYLAE